MNYLNRSSLPTPTHSIVFVCGLIFVLVFVLVFVPVFVLVFVLLFVLVFALVFGLVFVLHFFCICLFVTHTDLQWKTH